MISIDCLTLQIFIFYFLTDKQSLSKKKQTFFFIPGINIFSFILVLEVKIWGGLAIQTDDVWTYLIGVTHQDEGDVDENW